MFNKEMTIAGFDDDIWNAIQEEETRQEEPIELIASENYTSPRVMQAQDTGVNTQTPAGYPQRHALGGWVMLVKGGEGGREQHK